MTIDPCPYAVVNVLTGEVWSCRLMTRRGQPCREKYVKALRKGWRTEGCNGSCQRSEVSQARWRATVDAHIPPTGCPWRVEVPA